MKFMMSSYFSSTHYGKYSKAPQTVWANVKQGYAEEAHFDSVAFEEQAQEADCQSFTTAPFLRDVTKGQRQRLFVFRHDVSNVFSPKLYTMNHTNIYIYIYIQ